MCKYDKCYDMLRYVIHIEMEQFCYSPLLVSVELETPALSSVGLNVAKSSVPFFLAVMSHLDRLDAFLHTIDLFPFFLQLMD